MFEAREPLTKSSMNHQLGLFKSGIYLISLTCLSAFFTGMVAYPRAMLSAHLLGMLGGLLLICVGVVLPHLHLTEGMTKLAVASMNVGSWISAFGAIYSSVTGGISTFRHFAKDPAPAVKAAEIHHHLSSAFDLSSSILVFIGLALVAFGFSEKKVKEVTKERERKPAARTARSSSRSGTPRKKNL